MTSVDYFHEWNSSIEGQAAYTIFEKYKRKYDFQLEDLRILNLSSWCISQIRRMEGKVPNINYLEQKLVEIVKHSYEIE